MRNYATPNSIGSQQKGIKKYSRQHTITSRKWPPPPTVEDEEASLHRKQCPTSPDLEDSDPRVKGTIDQLPILVEIGKEVEHDRKDAGGRIGEYQRSAMSSSDDSIGPDTPVDSNASDSNDAGYERNHKQFERSLGTVIMADGRRRPDASKRTGSERPPDRSRTTANLPPPTIFHRSSSSKDVRMTQDAERSYTSHLDGLRDNPRDAQRLGLTEKGRSVSSSNITPNYRPAQTRHMSATGHSGESQAPSIVRGNMYASPVSAHPRDMLPEFHRPRGGNHNFTFPDSSDGEISPSEMSSKTTQLGMASERRPRPFVAFPVPQQSSPMGLDKNHIRSLKHNYQSDKTSKPFEKVRGRHHDPPSPLSNRSSRTTSPISLRQSQPGSPESSGHPFTYPITNNSTSQVQLKQRLSSPAKANSYSSHHTTTNSRRSSRPNSPTLHPKRASLNRTSPSRTEIQGDGRSSAQFNHRVFREPSPTQPTRSSRSPNPNLRIQVESPFIIPASQTWTTPNQEMRQRPLSRESSAGVFVSSPTIPMSAPNWAPSESRSSAGPKVFSEKVQQTKSHKQMIICPRPGFTTNYNDWWTVPHVPDLDLCPACKEGHEKNGFPNTFIRSQIRTSGTRTRCDMNVPWVRIACLLILSGRERSDILKDLMIVLGNEDECPGGQMAIRKKWYRVYDDDAGKHVSNFNVCPVCVRSIRVLFPNLDGIFESRSSGLQQPRICDLTACVLRFAKYIDLLDSISAEARLRREAPKTKNFIRLTKDFAGIRPCRRDDQFRGTEWHYTPHLPDFTICEECFMEVVRPAQRAGYAVADLIPRESSLPANINTKLSCQLYSPRMRAIFEECCRNQDIASLKIHATARVKRERELQDHVDTIRSLPAERQEQDMDELIEEWRRWE